jgi:DNA-binding Lrp family transcriptional regulator
LFCFEHRARFKSETIINVSMVTESALNDDWQGFSASSFSERDTDVLNLISREALTRFTFDGLKRRLGVHSETLSRILNRLEQEGIVEKGLEGYRVTSRINGYPRPSAQSSDENCVPLLQTLVPSNVPKETLIQNLRGKWFGLLRWLGSAEGTEGITLKWVTEDGGIQVEASISESVLTIEAKFLRHKDLNLALKASYQLMAHIGRLCSRSHLVRDVAYISNLGLDMTSA